MSKLVKLIHPLVDNNVFIFFIFKLNVRLRLFLFGCVRLCSRPVFTNCS
ncbi:hypothetical protein Hanom_Chr13g01239411 [Helianthus anomalus]